VKPTHLWHVHVENKAKRILQIPEAQELLTGSEDLNPKAQRSDQFAGSLANRGIIVYKREYLIPWHRASHCFQGESSTVCHSESIVR
jgi:hypothetical protein